MARDEELYDASGFPISDPYTTDEVYDAGGFPVAR